MATILLGSRYLILFQLLLLPSFILSTDGAKTTEDGTINFGNPFDDSFEGQLKCLGDAKIEKEALQLTRDTGNVDSFFVNNSGRIIYRNPYKIWDDSTNQSSRKIISFSSVFDFNIYPLRNTTPGEGLAFVIVPDSDVLPINSHGQYLGLTNSTIDGDEENKIIAVEFDTLKQSFDPDDNHVGLNINGVRSVAATSLSIFNITLASLRGVKYRCWIDYNGTQREMKVYVAVMNSPKPATPVLGAALDVGAYLAQRSYFGFAASTGEYFQLNCILGWNLTVEILSEKRVQGIPWFSWIIVAVLLVLAIGGILLWFSKRRKEVQRNEGLAVELELLPGMPREFKYRLLKKATGNFSPHNILGEGGYAVVYKGTIPDEDMDVAVKRFLQKTTGGDFLSELTIINRLRHRNLVRLIGWCHTNTDLLLVYEFMPKGSLDTHLFSEPPAPYLSWRQRHRILADVASAVHYLHEGYNERVIHRDIKVSNVLLDDNFNARLGDFGLARAIDQERTSYVDEKIHGTDGYIAPECFHTGKMTAESDIFAFGTVILEVVCGRSRNRKIGIYNRLLYWVWSLYVDGKVLDAIDSRLSNENGLDEAERLLLLGLVCSHPNAMERPKIHDVLQIINGTGVLPEVPRVKPAFSWPADCGDLNLDSAVTAPRFAGIGSSRNILLDNNTGQSDFRDVTPR